MTGLLATARFAAALVATSFKAALALRGTFVLQVAFMALNNLVFFVFWRVLFARVPIIRGYTLPDVALLFGVVAAGFGLSASVAGGVHRLARLIHEGELDAFLTQPKPTLLYVAGSQTRAAGLGDLASGIAFIGLSGAVHVRGLPALAAAIVGSALVLTGSAITYQSLAFWLGRSEIAARQLTDSLITFSLYPDSLFGGTLRLVLISVLPAAFVGHVPARLVREPSLGLAVTLLAAAAAYVALAAWIFARGLRNYRSGSRFATLE